ncbi:homoserine dehydrogenase [Marinicellulosiphila megalodicopiae]|uniref:homoserine dehydrogenase n=1 Tax=Marinicellulosiphila megalodicopiae TaxID=2724896 RepID=UPI003BB19650
MKSVNVGLCGLGTVGGGTYRVLRDNQAQISARAGFPINITHIGMRTVKEGYDYTGITVSQDLLEVTIDPNVDVVVELIGGYDLAKEIVMSAIENGKHVVTANKALIAVHGNEIFAAASKKGVTVNFEAAVAGGIPIIKAMREGLVANKVTSLAGIINGTGNFILTEMRDKGRAFEDVLKEAQELGYAEADPTFDVEGIDAAHKLTILASIAFGMPLQFEKAYTEGISKITAQDVNYAEELGYRIKHLGVAVKRENGIEMRVHPTLIPEKSLIANVNGVLNAVLVNCDAVGQTMYSGAGAGDTATASSVIADIVDVARLVGTNARPVPHLGFGEIDDSIEILDVDQSETGFYLRIEVSDKVGVMAKIAQIMSENAINIEAILQKEPAEDAKTLPVIMLTHKVKEQDMNTAIKKLEALDDVVEPVVRIRVEHLNG